jgi:transposase
MIGLPRLSELDRALLDGGVRLWLCTSGIDMRLGFDRLAELAREVSGQDPFSGHLFLFRGRNSDRLKVLAWDKDGFILWYKRLEEGVFKLPRVPEGTRSVELRASELAMLLEGIDLSSIKRSKRYRRRAGADQPSRSGNQSDARAADQIK